MTIGKTGNRIVDKLARDRAKSQAEEKKAKGSAKKSGSRRNGGSAKKSTRRSKGGKFKGAGRAGRAAARRPAKGICAKYIGKSGSAGKVVSYGLKEGAELIISNCGYDIPSIASGLAKRLRKNIKNQIVRMTFSTPSTSGQATASEWRERVEYIRQQLGIDDSFAYCASRHTDAEHDHIHLDFNRVSDVGELWSDSLIGLRLAKLEQLIEQKFSLKLTRREDFVTHGNANKKALERSLRLQENPAFIAIQSSIKNAILDNPDVLTFIERMADRGIAVRPNLKLSELNGFGYQLGSSRFTGKQLGMNWSLMRERIGYEPNEHFEILADIKREIDAGTSRPYDPEQGIAVSFGYGQGEPAEMDRRSGKSGKDNQVQKSGTQEVAVENRGVSKAPVRSRATNILSGLLLRMDERRKRFMRLSERLQAEREGDALIARFCAALDPEKTDSEVAQFFLKNELGSSAARSLVETHLDMSKEELQAVLLPYQAAIKAEMAHAKRMADAERQSTAPTAKPSAGDLPAM